MEDFEGVTPEEISAVKNYLGGYQFCLDMLNLRQYERKRAFKFDEDYDCEDLVAGNEAFWRSRLMEIVVFLGQMKNNRAKLVLHYHFVKGESVERTADLLGVSRRTGYRLYHKGLAAAAELFRSFSAGK